ncbi:tetratricopeptide repeat protein [Saccharicrinis fermentans]|uniref:Lipoprotein NlpI n=1 Tax=Saccharicrinis fermentans DSM 9555 = JCM 21142 TaxID=869213 RepID=W7YIH3_9BACT|nr:tetratricopeptide repeat protein [Saccharicrinis fermentans]GAF04276.1 lipoprotein NlpI [Saccharicrinis fermentans DSM 9555 = JCM 21142]
MRKIFFSLHIFFLFAVTTSSYAQIDTDRVLIIGRNALYYEDYVLAISYFNKVIRVKPYLADPYYFRAYAKYSLDDLKGAEKDMDKAIEINPFHASYYRFRADIRNKFGSYEKALEDYAKGLEISPQDQGIYFNRGLVYMNIKDYKKSIDDFTSVLKIDNAQYGAYINRAISKLNLKDTIGAVQDMDEAIEVNPLVADAYRFSAFIYYDINDFEKAIARINEAIKLDSHEASYYMMRGVIRYQMDNLTGTMQDFDKVIELEPKNTMAYANRGLLRVEVGDVNNAIDDFSRVLALNPNDLLTLFNRSLLYIRIGEYHDAIADLNLIIDHYPEYSGAYMARAQAYSGINNSAAAGKDYNMAYKLEQDNRKKAERNTADNKPKETRAEKDDDIRNHDKIAVLDDFGIDENEVEEIDNLRGKIQNRNIIIDLETVYGLTFFSVDSLINRTRYFKPEVTQFNQRIKFGRPLIFSNREAETDGDKEIEYFTSIKKIGDELQKTPDNNDLRFTRAILYGVVLNYTSAIGEYDYIIENSKDENFNLFPYFNRAYIRYKMVEMMQQFNEEELPVNLLSQNTSAGLKKDDGVKSGAVVKQMLDYQLIERDLRKVLEIDPGFEFAYYNLGILQCIRKDYEAAILNFNKAIELNPFFAEAYFNRGLTQIYLKNDEQGTLDLSKAGELGLYKAYNVIKRYGMQRILKNTEQNEEEKDK